MKTRTGINGVVRVHFGLPDLEEAVRYYENFGLTIVEEDADRVYLRGTGADHFLLALYRTGQPRFLCADLSIETREQADALHAALVAARVEASAPGPLVDPGGGYGFAFRDPVEGRPFRVVTGVARHDNAQHQSNRPSKVAHLVLNSADRDDPFFADLLGFKVIDRSKTITFLNCNSDHHSLAFYAAVAGSFNHIAFEVPDINSVMSATATMVERGAEIGWGVGRHGPCDNVFCYFVGPGGFTVEYTAEVEQVDETYKVGGPDDWGFPEGRRDQWGLAFPTPRMRSAEARVPFADGLFDPSSISSAPTRADLG